MLAVEKEFEAARRLEEQKSATKKKNAHIRTTPQATRLRRQMMSPPSCWEDFDIFLCNYNWHTSTTHTYEPCEHGCICAAPSLHVCFIFMRHNVVLLLVYCSASCCSEGTGSNNNRYLYSDNARTRTIALHPFIFVRAPVQRRHFIINLYYSYWVPIALSVLFFMI